MNALERNFVLVVLRQGCIRPVLNDETSSLEEFVERDDLWAPCVSPIKLEGAELRYVNSTICLKLLKRTDN